MNVGERIGYVIPEWPGQTHIWIWREICHMREFGATLRLFSTRRPPDRDRSRHPFTEQAIAETTYLWPIGVGRVLWYVLVAFLRNPVGFFKAIHLARTLPIDEKPAWKRLLPLIVPACYLAHEVRRDGITHIHSHVPASSTIICMMVKRLTGVGFSQIVNANLEWWGGAMREKFKDARFTTFCTQWMIDQMHREYSDVDASTYGLCRVAVDVRKWTPPASRPPAADGALRLLTVSRLVTSKGQDVLLRAIALLRGRGLNVRLRIGGDGPERDALTKLAAELKVDDCVTFLGSLAEDRYLAEMLGADVFVLASHGEPMGVVYMESMATEAATVGTAAGGVGEIITDGVDGVLVPPRNPEALADGIERLARDPELRARLGRAGREKILREFDSRAWAAELYRRIFGRLPTFEGKVQEAGVLGKTQKEEGVLVGV